AANQTQTAQNEAAAADQTVYDTVAGAGIDTSEVTNMNSAILLVFATCVPPQSSTEKSPIDTTRTSSPYQSIIFFISRNVKAELRAIFIVNVWNQFCH
ncbi:hypothetical protein NE634_19860, partial [Lacrimispora saccharolytica]|nr:hypothetical protein [Lacrimispora saccharolytica]